MITSGFDTMFLALGLWLSCMFILQEWNAGGRARWRERATVQVLVVDDRDRATNQHKIYIFMSIVLFFFFSHYFFLFWYGSLFFLRRRRVSESLFSRDDGYNESKWLSLVLRSFSNYHLVWEKIIINYRKVIRRRKKKKVELGNRIRK